MPVTLQVKESIPISQKSFRNYITREKSLVKIKPKALLSRTGPPYISSNFTRF